MIRTTQKMKEKSNNFYVIKAAACTICTLEAVDLYLYFTLNPLSTKKFFVSDFSQTLYKNPPRCPNKPTYIRLLKYVTTHCYKFIWIFIFSAFLKVRFYPSDFYCWKPEFSWTRIRWNFWDISFCSQDISKTVLIFLISAFTVKW